MLTLDYEENLTPLLHLIESRLTDMRVPLTAILEDGLSSAQTQVNVGKGTSWGDPAWAPMSKATIKTGRDPRTLLVKSGALADSLSRGGAGGIFVVDALTAEGGTGVTYAGYQQNGTRRNGREHIPARPFLKWYEDRFDHYDKLIGDWAIGETKADA